MKNLFEKLKSYVRPTDGTWWVGLLAITSGVLQFNGLDVPGVSTVVRPVLTAYFGGAGPLILAGMGMITLNAKFAREGGS